jgi:ribulose-5-phosphate 4-epimerase/fuculose-1-phosphate aldolase
MSGNAAAKLARAAAFWQGMPRPQEVIAVNVTVARERISAAEWAVRCDLAAFYRLVDHFQLTDLVFNHITARVPGGDHHVLINRYGLGYNEITASNLVKVDLDGTPIDDPAAEINPAGYIIHSCIHRARADVGCVAHTHSPSAVAVSALASGFMALDQQSLQFHGDVAYHDFEGIAVAAAEQARLVRDLGTKRILLLRHHGLLACGATVPETFRLLYYFERACCLQLHVLATGAPLAPLSPELAAFTARQWREGAAAIGGGDVLTREWPWLLRLLDRKDPRWRD